MLVPSFVLSLAVAAQLASGKPIKSRSEYVVKESHFVPRGWTNVGTPSADHKIDLSIALKQGQFDELERHLYEVSDPDHHRYGQHLTGDEVHELVKPSDDSLNSVHDWLHENGIKAEKLTYSPAKDWIHLTVPVELAELLLDTEYSKYQHEDGSQLVRTTKFSLPLHLHKHVDSIQPTTSFLRSAPKNVEYIAGGAVPEKDYVPPTDPAIAKLCNISSVSPQCFMELYKTKGYVPKAKGNSIAFNNFLAEVPIRPDLKKFIKKYRPDADSSRADTFPQLSIAGGPTQSGPITPSQLANGTCREANLDVQAITGISYPIPVVSYSTGGSPPFIPDDNTPTNTNEPYAVWLNYILAQKSIPQVISTSYADDEQSVPKAYALRVCQQMAQLGARGTSALFAAGDAGVGSNGTCYSNDGKNTTMFLPLFPTGCPYVTAVGATRDFSPERVADRPASTDKNGVKHGSYVGGSGFSNYFPRPAYQKTVVDAYVKGLKGEFKGLYNSEGRGYPDLSAQGLYFAYFWNNTEGTISGTSASTPLMSGILALVNDALISSGKPALGFLNPWLYKTGYKGFTDITVGSGRGCETSGFPAVKGWDAVTGFGTPIFPELVKLAKEACE